MKEVNYGTQNIASFGITENSLAIIDTGTSLACMPHKYFKLFLSLIRGQITDKNLQVTCEKDDKEVERICYIEKRCEVIYD